MFVSIFESMISFESGQIWCYVTLLFRTNCPELQCCCFWQTHTGKPDIHSQALLNSTLNPLS